MGERRDKGSGSVTKRPGGVWQAQVTVKGKRESRTFATKREATKWLRDRVTEVERGQRVTVSRETVGDYLDRWFRATKGTLRSTTAASYASHIRLYFKPSIGGLLLSDLRNHHVQAVYDGLTAQGRAPGTVRRAHATLRKALEDALVWDLVTHNAATRGIKLPRQEEYAAQVLTVLEAQKLMDEVREDRLYAFYRTALTTGMRLSELRGLHWSEVNLDRATVTVRQTLQRRRDAPGSEMQDTKNRSSIRVIDLDEPTVEALREWQQQQRLERVALGPKWAGNGHTFTSQIGSGVNESNLRRGFRRHLKRAGLPGIRIYDLRHTSATLMLAAGVPVKVVSERLGHSSIAMTLRVYAHVLPSMQQQAARTLGELLGG